MRWVVARPAPGRSIWVNSSSKDLNRGQQRPQSSCPVPLDERGYGRLLWHTLRIARVFYERLLAFADTLAEEFRVTPIALPDTTILDYCFNPVGNDRLDRGRERLQGRKASCFVLENPYPVWYSCFWMTNPNGLFLPPTSSQRKGA